MEAPGRTSAPFQERSSGQCAVRGSASDRRGGKRLPSQQGDVGGKLYLACPGWGWLGSVVNGSMCYFMLFHLYLIIWRSMNWGDIIHSSQIISFQEKHPSLTGFVVVMSLFGEWTSTCFCDGS